MAFLAACLAICLFINQALAFPLPVKHALGTIGGPRVTWPELAFYSIFITGERSRESSIFVSGLSCIPLSLPSLAAIIVSILGAYIQSGMTEVRASAILRSFHRTSHHPSTVRLGPSH